ncbi:S8 family peptidase [Candidatus Uabimicrobium sp. HlEnr_7]|uniref:S8 family peptidase n=1 Tax=Candidatus Uabimicrobium helgolandensis TaxID=3095367 RepID=UPI003558E88B
MKKLPHIAINILPNKLDFTSTQKVVLQFETPKRSREDHAKYLRNRLDECWEKANEEKVIHHTTSSGIYLEFEGEEGYDLITKSLEEKRAKSSEKWTRLLNVRSVIKEVVNPKTNKKQKFETKYATVFIPNSKKHSFFKKIERYSNEINKKSGKPKHFDLINSISNIKKALNIKSFWVDHEDLIPGNEKEWCEVWLSSNENYVIERFEELLKQEGIISKPSIIRFPERTVKIIKVNMEQLKRLTIYSDDIAEYRKAKTTASFWTENIKNSEQAEWAQDLIDRVKVMNDQVSICILDSGVNLHPLLKPILNQDDCQAVMPEWGPDDHVTHGHGTCMAGIAAYGNLEKQLISSNIIELKHSLESVKIIPPQGKNNQDLWGYITSQGINLAEIQSPNKIRLLCMAVSSEDTIEDGCPTSWSSKLDQLAAGIDYDVAAIKKDFTESNNPEISEKRLIVVSAGNADISSEIAKNYPNSQIEQLIHDPAQSWNVLTVGAYTELDEIKDSSLKNYTPIAQKGELSPFTTTSLMWDDKWPIKPEIVMEGGNLAIDTNDFVSTFDDLSILSTSKDPQTSYFTSFNMTSAATAKAAWFAAQIQAEYPNFWPETVRALIVHSSEWPESLKKQFLKDNKKSSLKKLLRIAGYGVPNLEKALYSASNSLTLIVQEEIQPFQKKDGRCKTKDMHLHEIPWPKEVLLGLPDSVKVSMRITLSYFIEPGPGELGWKDRYRYPSHGLRFKINSPGQSKDEFIKGVNLAAREEDEIVDKTDTSKCWMIGKNARDKGSIHSDIWRGTASELAMSNLIAIFPTVGWWRERQKLVRWDSKTRYSLLVSIDTSDQNIDIYTPVINKIQSSISINY